MFWNRKELKQSAKEAMKRNYWSSVLVAIIYCVLLGFVNNFPSVLIAFSSLGNSLQMDVYTEPQQINTIGTGTILAAIILCVLVRFFIVNPAEVGMNYFKLNALKGIGQVSDIKTGFSTSYGRNVKTMFLCELKIFLWSMLFVIPGIIKRYEYRMVPYILAEDPTIDAGRAMELSKMLMVGSKWKAFILDLSFIPWYYLGGMTFGILNIFKVNPYVYLTDAALYEKVKAES